MFTLLSEMDQLESTSVAICNRNTAVPITWSTILTYTQKSAARCCVILVAVMIFRLVAYHTRENATHANFGAFPLLEPVLEEEAKKYFRRRINLQVRRG